MTGNGDVEKGTVTAVLGSEAWVRMNVREVCENCTARILCVPDHAGKRMLKVSNTIQARVGQNVVITEKPEFLFYLSFLQYGIPIIGFSGGILIPFFLNLSIPFLPYVLSLFIFGLSGLGLCSLAGHRLISSLAKRGQTFFSISHPVTTMYRTNK
jgi:positive regulator of sigma E activity